MATSTAEVVRDGFQYLEGIRWHNDELWFSDIPRGTVYRMGPEGELAVAATVHKHPSGLGFTPNGFALVVTQDDCCLRRITPSGDTEVVADMSKLAFAANDMWVDPQGRAYVGQIGYDLFGGGEAKGSHLIVVDPDGTVRAAGKDLLCPNGVQLTPDGKTLVVAESFAQRLTAFDVNEQGELSNQRVFAQFDNSEAVVDGLCIDAEGAVWVACPFLGEVRRVIDGGEVTDQVRVATDGHLAIACALGGADRRTLYVIAADTTLERMSNDYEGTARVEAAAVQVPAT